MRDFQGARVSRSSTEGDGSRVGWIIAIALFVVGLGVFALATLGGAAPSLRWIGAVFLVAALAEGVTGLVVHRRGQEGVAFILGGALTLFFGVYAVTQLSEKPHAIALLFGLYLVMNATFRGLVLIVERRMWPYELLYVVTAFILAGILMTGWGGASARLVAASVGVELVARGVALFGSSKVVAPRRLQQRERTPLIL